MTPVKRVVSPGGGWRNIAVLRLSSLGDVVLALPAAHALRRAFPGARLAFWTFEEYADLVRADPALDHVRVLEPDARRIEDVVAMSAELEDCDLIVDLHASLRTRVLTFRQKARVLRIDTRRLQRARWVHARWTRPRPLPHALERYAATVRPLGAEVEGPPRVTVDAAAETWAREWLAAWQPGAPPVALCPGAAHATKRWPERHWLALADALAAAGRPMLWFGTARERAELPLLAERATAGPHARWVAEPLARVAALLSACAVAVTGDTGLMHLAAARGVRVVAMFGSTVPELGFSPAGEGHQVLCRREPCQPCTLHGRPRCPLGHFRCMEALDPDGVRAALARVL